jgi:hypothetical protein
MRIGGIQSRKSSARNSAYPQSLGNIFPAWSNAIFCIEHLLQVRNVRSSLSIVRAKKRSACLCAPLAYDKFIESHIFYKQVSALLSDDEFALFQGFLFSNPKAGAVIQQTGGLRKFARRSKEKAKAAGCG